MTISAFLEAAKKAAAVIAGALCLLGIAGVAWTDGYSQGTKIEQTPVAVVEESGHRRVRCE